MTPPELELKLNSLAEKLHCQGSWPSWRADYANGSAENGIVGNLHGAEIYTAGDEMPIVLSAAIENSRHAVDVKCAETLILKTGYHNLILLRYSIYHSRTR